MTAIRINKYLCASGLLSRKAADVLIKRGAVQINGRQAILGETVGAGDTVTLDGQRVAPLPLEKTIVLALNKPVGVVCTAARSVEHNIVDFVAHDSRVFPVGRLDKASQGLILLTNRSDLANKILSAGNQHEKEYRVTVNKDITEEFMAGMSHGVPMLGVVTRRCVVVRESDRVFRITLVQGLNRQIRRMCRHFHYSVMKLERIRIMHVELQNLPIGQWRYLTAEERAVLLTL